MRFSHGRAAIHLSNQLQPQCGFSGSQSITFGIFCFGCALHRCWITRLKPFTRMTLFVRIIHNLLILYQTARPELNNWRKWINLITNRNSESKSTIITIRDRDDNDKPAVYVHKIELSPFSKLPLASPVLWPQVVAHLQRYHSTQFRSSHPTHVLLWVAWNLLVYDSLLSRDVKQESAIWKMGIPKD